MNIGYKGIASYYRVTHEEAWGMYQKKADNIVFIDLRNKSELINGYIPNSISIPLDIFRDSFLELDKNNHYIMVCSFGGRSSIASNLLGTNGFENVYNLQGGMLEWVTHEYDLEFDEKQ